MAHQKQSLLLGMTLVVHAKGQKLNLVQVLQIVVAVAELDIKQ
jgi:hypothetical protein